ncbi:MAG: alkaline phosphatase family protein [Dehalococcoidia bacterium]|nr:alkaline phosphatase family protein [Dehalococcoidia bacterium]
MPKTTVLITIDGLDPEYMSVCDAPNLREMAKHGFHINGKCMMPSVTNVNNVSVVTGKYPTEHGISSNYRLVRETGEEIYMESGEYILAETFFQRAARMGATSILSTSKDKLRTLLSEGASTAISSERAPGWAVDAVGEPPPIYSLDVNGWTIRAATEAMKRSPADIVYISTTDFAMHTYAPNEPESQQHITILDDAIGDLVEAHPDVTLFLTADHGMSPKSRMAVLDDVFSRHGIAAQAVPIIKDRYVVHHNNLGGCMFIDMDAGHSERTEEAAEVLRETVGVERVYTRSEAVEELRLNYDRIGDLVVTGDSETVFGPKELSDSWNDTGAGSGLRSHASAHEQDVPIIGYNGDFDGFEFSENRDLGRYVFERVLG